MSTCATVLAAVPAIMRLVFASAILDSREILVESGLFSCK